MEKYRLMVILSLVWAVPLISSVDLDIGSDLVVETSIGVRVEIDGDLTGTGYFKGKITSGSRTGMTAFAGMTLSSGMDGTITRTTGSAYSGGHGEGTNLKRYYEFSNTGGDAVTADMTVAYLSSGSNDEQNGLSGPYFVYRYTSEWTGYGDGTSSSPISAGSVEIPTGSSDWIFSEGVRVAVKVFLEGPYDASGDTMSTTLCPDDYDVIPNISPYSEDDRTCSTIPAGVTDWVLVEVRSTVDGAALGSRSCFLKAEGTIVGDDGTTAYVGVCCLPDDYFLVIRHRNHLDIETAAVVSDLTWGTTPASAYDFTTGTDKYHGSDACLLETDVYGMYAGDGNESGIVTISDANLAITNRDAVGYEMSDYNLSGIVTISDANQAISNRDAHTNVQ